MCVSVASLFVRVFFTFFVQECPVCDCEDSTVGDWGNGSSSLGNVADCFGWLPFMPHSGLFTKGESEQISLNAEHVCAKNSFYK